MPSLDQVLAHTPTESDHAVLQGTLVSHAGALYLRVGDSAALYGPVADGTTRAAVGLDAVVVISQLGTPWVVGVGG